MKKIIRLTESDLKKIVSGSVMRIISEMNEGNGLYDEWYDQEDYNGQTGEPGMVKSYEIGHYYMGQAENDAREAGYDNVSDYLQYWFSKIQPECPWYCTKVNGGYGYNGTTVFRNDGVVCKDISGQIIIDEYPIGDARRNADFEERLNKGEYWTK